LVEDYDFGKIVIDRKIYRSDLIIYDNKIEDNWRRQEGHSLCADDIKTIEVLNISLSKFKLWCLTSKSPEVWQRKLQ